MHAVHCAVPELDLDEVSLAVSLLGKPLRVPLIINAMTGGTAQGAAINRDLAAVAAEFGLGMAVGSQAVALEDPSLAYSFQVVRQVNPDGLLLANVSARVSPDAALRAVEMVGADALQVHLNVPQELAMPEGDRGFRGLLENLTRLVSHSPVPVVAKEVGFGLSREAAAALLETGVAALDVGGAGGTNFLAIESARGGPLGQEMTAWGIPTVASLLEVLSLQPGVPVVASGGIQDALQAAKALALGANAVGMAAWFLHRWHRGGAEEVRREVAAFEYRLRAAVLMSGAASVDELGRRPVVITGATAEWLRARDIDVRRWALPKGGGGG